VSGTETPETYKSFILQIAGDRHQETVTGTKKNRRVREEPGGFWP